ncbi:MAG: pyridoxal-phosphate dependent enzyme [Candidatus Berkiellales bacterium]
MKKKPFYIHTPILQSHILSQLIQKKVYLKYESLQPSGSFKDRGIGLLCQHYAKEGVKGYIASSGGNAGMAVAYASQVHHLPATIVIPKTTPHMMVAKLKAENAQVIVAGDDWDAADQVANEMAKTQNLAYIPPFNHPTIWQGYETIIEELVKDKIKPDAILLSVGGGGLYSGIAQGLHRVGWQDVAIITAETAGAASLAASMLAKKRVHLDKIETIAVTLGAKQICQNAFEWTQKHPTYPETVTDKEAVMACLRFADDHRLLVEPACGASLAVIYEKRAVLQQFHSIVVIVCGGSGVSLSLFKEWLQQFGLQPIL